MCCVLSFQCVMERISRPFTLTTTFSSPSHSLCSLVCSLREFESFLPPTQIPPSLLEHLRGKMENMARKRTEWMAEADNKKFHSFYFQFSFLSSPFSSLPLSTLKMTLIHPPSWSFISICCCCPFPLESPRFVERELFGSSFRFFVLFSFF